MRTIRIRGLESACDEGVHRVEAEVDGARVWFTTPDVALIPSPEAIATAFLIPALAHSAQLESELALDPLWRGNVVRLMGVLADWWRLPVIEPQTVVARAPRKPGPDVSHPPSPQAGDPGRRPQTALFFSGGVDSFHVLLRGDESIDLLATLHGFDFPSHDRARAAGVEQSLRAVAAAVGAKPVFVRTNVREHHLQRGVSWDWTHGSALAGVGHLLAGCAGRALIAPSLPGDQEMPWGSHEAIDPLWSSSRMAIAHARSPRNRLERFRSIAHEALVHEHLRVCWRNSTPTGNCSRCAKCVLAMLMLEEAGEFHRSKTFDGQGELIERVRALRRTSDRFHTMEEIADAGKLSPDLEREVRALVRRSRIDMSGPVQVRRRVVGRVLSWLGIARP